MKGRYVEDSGIEPDYFEQKQGEREVRLFIYSTYLQNEKT